jgi:hypothetical protein
MRKFLVLVLVLVVMLSAIGCSKRVPTAPTFPTATPTAVATAIVSKLNVTLSAISPASANLLEGQSAEVAKFIFTNTSATDSVTVINVSVSRDAMSTNTILTKAYLYNNGINIAETSSISAYGTILFENGSGLITISPGLSVELTVKLDIGTTGAGGQSFVICLTGVTANTPPDCILPLCGSIMNIQ